MKWNDEMFNDAKRMWGDGSSASEIAMWLSAQYKVRVSRNAVLGKLHRAGVPRLSDESIRRRLRHSGRKAARALSERRSNTSQAKPARPLLVALPQIAPDPSDKATMTVAQITDDRCKFIGGEPSGTKPTFCGRKALPGIRYCAKHGPRVFENWEEVKTSKVRAKAKERENA